MIKKALILSIVSAVILAIVLPYMIYLNTVDTKYAAEFADVLSTYDIYDIDNYFSYDTKIICGDNSKSYGELRDNVISACVQKRYIFPKRSSYGHSNDSFLGDVQNIKIFLYGTFDNSSIGQVSVDMKLKKCSLLEFEIVSVECDHELFKHIFYGTN